jgi:hypothetical protein
MKIYAGVGSRKTPAIVLKRMHKIAQEKAENGWILRSGGADGADKWFEMGCDTANGKKEIYLPFKGFNGNQSPLFNIPEYAFDIAGRLHPNWFACSAVAKKLLARNVLQILGQDLNKPADVVICWSDGSGGTQQTIRIAKKYGVEVVNLFYA